MRRVAGRTREGGYAWKGGPAVLVARRGRKAYPWRPTAAPAVRVARARTAGCRRERAYPWDAGRRFRGRRAYAGRGLPVDALRGPVPGVPSPQPPPPPLVARALPPPLPPPPPPPPSPPLLDFRTPPHPLFPPNSSILWHALLSAPFPRFNSCATLSSPLIFVLSPVPAGAGASLSPNPFPSSSPFSPLLSLPHLPDSISLPPPHRLSICLNVSLSLNLFLSLASSLGFCPSPLTFQRPLIPRLSRPFHSPTPGFAEARGAPKTAPLAEMLKPHMYMRTAAWAQISPRRRREARVFASHSARIYRREMKWGLRKGLVAAVRLKTTSVSFGVKRSFPYLLIPCCSRSFPTSSFLVAHLAPSY